MTNATLAHLNRLLRDHLGMTPAGGSLYKWFHSRDPEMFTLIGRLGSLDVKAQYERVPQVWEHRYVLGVWQPPPSEATWALQFQGQMPYPRGGYYMVCSIPSDPLLERGIEPNERITMYTIQLRKKQLAMGMMGVYRSYAEGREYIKRGINREMDAALTDRWTSCEPVVPGASAEHFN